MKTVLQDKNRLKTVSTLYEEKLFINTAETVYKHSGLIQTI